MAGPATLFDKIWSSHAILVRPHDVTLLRIDRHLVHDGSGNAFRKPQGGLGTGVTRS
jgi:3-isopropylmalate/(R)-2-methylmalate dehydratase large subunit